ncbi:Cysteine rich repeat protein [compost metagenome]
MKTFLVSCLMITGFSFTAYGQGEMMAGHMSACSGDIERFCPGVEMGDGRIAKCLHKNKNKLSAECKASRDKMKSAMMEVKAACHDDFEKFCAETKAGKGRVMKCMKAHENELSATCKAEIEEKKSSSRM